MRRGRRSLTFAVCWLVSSSLSRCNAASWPIWAGAVSCGPAPSTAATDACFVGEDERDAGIPVVRSKHRAIWDPVAHTGCTHWVHTLGYFVRTIVALRSGQYLSYLLRLQLLVFLRPFRQASACSNVARNIFDEPALSTAAATRRRTARYHLRADRVRRVRRAARHRALSLCVHLPHPQGTACAAESGQAQLQADDAAAVAASRQ